MLKQRIVERVRRNGSLSFDAYMEMCLYDPEDGFFAAGDVRPGTGADFVTSPEVSPWFGRLIGRWVEDAIRDDSILVEVGAGSGALLGPLVDELRDLGHAPATWAVERSARAREGLLGLRAKVNVVDAIDDIPTGGHAVVVMNEVLDNVPAALVEGIDGRWHEVRVVEADGELGTEPQPMDRRPELEEWCHRFLGDPQPNLLAAQTGAMHLIDRLLRRFDDVSFCIIDYGAATSELAGRPRNDVVRTFRGQRTGFGWFELPGATDLTVEVNTDVVRSTLPDRALFESQAAFLRRLGAGEVVAALTDASHRRARDGDTMGQLVARSDATGVRALLEPAGLGGFFVATSTLGGT